MIRQYKALKLSTIIPVLCKARTKIYISCDLWTSSASKAILGITAQFINKAGTLQSLVLALREVVKDYLRDNMSKYVLEVL
jgi:hypothetical protein